MLSNHIFLRIEQKSNGDSVLNNISKMPLRMWKTMIGVLCWIMELGRIVIHIHTAMMSSHMMQPREGHLKEVLHIFACLKHHANVLMIFEDIYVNWLEDSFPQHTWTNYYHGAKEELPPNMPEPRGTPVQINCFVDADHAGNRITR